MLELALLTLLGSMAWLFRRNCYANGKLLVNPVFGILAGTFYYILLPCTLTGYFGEVVGGITVYNEYFSAANAAFSMFFWAFALLSLGAGIGFARMVNRPTNHTIPMPTSRRRASVMVPMAVLCLMFLVLLGLAWGIRDSLFAGYDPDVLADEGVWQARGSMSSLYAMMSVIQLALLLRHRSLPLGRDTKLTMLLIFVTSSTLLLSMGARLYVIMALLGLMALYSHQQGGIGLRRFGILLGSALFLFGSIGVLRAKSVDGIAAILINVAAEPALTSISAFSLITDNPIPLIGKPWMFPVEFKAVIPSVILPGKELLFERLNEYGYAFEAPLGGYHVLFSMLINFGVIGTLVVMFIAGTGLGRMLANLTKHPDRTATCVAAAVLTGMLTFSFFRDPFFISVVKNVVVVSLLVPLGVGVWFHRPPRRRRTVPRNLAQSETST